MRRLGDYELLRKIGAGGMAEVWMGRRAAMAGASKAVAIKLLARDMLDDPDYRAMFIEEARLSMLLTNSNVVQVFDVGEIDGECFMVMEWVDGLNLAELTHKMVGDGGRLPVEVSAHIIGEVLRALAYAHGLHHDGLQATIVHRDVSPHNVLLSISGEIKLADFGVARLAREETSGLHVKGKLRYMAPEQLRGRSREPTVDLYAVGAILHELLQGERFRTTRDEGDLYSMVLSGQSPPLTVSVPAELEQLHTRLLEPDPSKRLQSADEGLELLYAWSGYRNSSLEIGRLIRKWVGVKAPRSGILSGAHVAAAVAASASGPAAGGSGPTPSAVVTKPVVDAPSGPALASQLSDAVTMIESHAESGPQSDRGATETRTAVEHSPEIVATAMIPTAGTAARPSQLPSTLIVAALTLAMSFGVFGLGFPLGWWGGEDPDDPDDKEVKAEEVKAEEVKAEEVKAEEVKAAEVEAAEVEAAEAGTGITGDEGLSDETSGAIGDSAGDGDGDRVTDLTKVDLPPPPLPKAEAKAEVSVAAGDMGWAYVRVGSKSMTIQPTGSLKIAPGTYTVKYRQDNAGPWLSAGKIEVKSGKSYKFKFSGGKLQQL